MAAILLPVLLAMAGMAVDVGAYASERRTLQNAADSIALAAGQELPDATAAQTKAEEYASEYGIDPGDVTVTITGGTTEPRVRVVVDRPHDFIFMGVVGIEDADVGATAAAGKFSYGGGEGIVPWSIEEATLLAAGSGEEVTIKYDSSGPSPGNGNFGAIRIDGNGASDYENSAKYGADSTICSFFMENCDPGDCPGTFPTGCGENSGNCDGADCDPKPGNMTGPTRDAVDFRVDYTSSDCDTFEEAFSPISASSDDGINPDLFAFDNAGFSAGGRLAAPAGHHGKGGHPTFTPTSEPATNTPTNTNTPSPTSTPTHTPTPAGPTNTPTSAPATNTPVPTNTPGGPTATNTAAPTSTPGSGSTDRYGINPDCNPWGGGACATQTSICSRRIFLIPIVDEFGNGSSDPVEIQGFALVFLEGYEGSCSGSSCDIKARFVRADATIGAYASEYSENAYNHFVRLTE